MSQPPTNTPDLVAWLPIAISVGALIVSFVSLGRNIVIEKHRRKSNLQVWQRNSYYEGGADNRTKINLVIRNLSHRPTAVIDIHVKNENGGVIKSIGASEEQLLPLKIEPWDVRIVSFRIERHEEEEMNSIHLSDIGDNQIVVERKPGTKWHGGRASANK